MTIPRRFLTGITTSGAPHLGNYAGAIQPALQLSVSPNAECLYFLADFHALIKHQDANRVHHATASVAASWMAAGLDPNKVVLYRQSDIPEITELSWLLTCVTAKGLLNRAHAYKAAATQNTDNHIDADAGVTAGLFMYPVLMAADILLFQATHVPVGSDQVQHIELARDIGARFNHLYGTNLVLPEAVVNDTGAILPGLDGRKMSKSYDNTIPMCAPAKELKRLIFAITTDSTPPGTPKTPDGSALFQLHQAFSTPHQSDALRQAYAAGISWSDAKQFVFERLDAVMAPMRPIYADLMQNPTQLETILETGAAKARALAAPLLQDVRSAVGIRPLQTISPASKPAPALKTSVPTVKQYRETNGFFHFKIIQSDGQTLLHSQPFESPKDAAAVLSAMISGASTETWLPRVVLQEKAALSAVEDVLRDLRVQKAAASTEHASVPAPKPR